MARTKTDRTCPSCFGSGFRRNRPDPCGLCYGTGRINF